MKHSTEILVELYKRKEFSQMPLFDKQLEALNILEDNITNELLFGGAARGGKSVLGCDWQLMRRLSMPESYSIIAREERTKLEATTLKTFFRRLKYYGLEKDIDYKWNAQRYFMEFNNGSHIFFIEIKYMPSDEEFDRLGSYDLTDAFLDESQQIHYKAIQVLKGRFSVTEGNGWKTIPKALYTCNPSKNWVNLDFVAPSKKGILPDRMKFIASLPKDNPYVPQSYFDNLETADETTKQRLLFGNFDYDDDPSALVDYAAILDMFTNDHVIGMKRYISADLAMQGRDKFIAGYWEGLRCHVDIDMKKSDGKQIEDSLNELRMLRGVGNSMIVADSDGLGQYLSAYIKNIRTFHGGRPAYVKNEFANLKSECAFKLAEHINNRNIKIICSPAQKEAIIKEISVCLKRDNTDSDTQKKKLIPKDHMKKLLGHSPDYLDMLIMRMYFEVGQSIFAG
jgi:hypothetical protein